MKGYFIRMGAFAGIMSLGYGGGYIITELQASGPELSDMSCISDFDVYTEHAHFKGVFTLFADNGKGVLQIKGNFLRSDSDLATVNRKVFFDYINYGEMLNMTSRKIDILPADNARFDEMLTLFPPFFYIPDLMHNFGFYHQANGRILTGTVIPVIYCPPP